MIRKICGNCATFEKPVLECLQATEYRELNAVIRAIWSVKISPDAEIFNALKRAIEEEVKNIEPADVRPVVRGEWEIMSNPKYRRCSVCHDKVMFNMKNLPNFCDVCGADMRPGPPKEDNNE